MAPLLFPGEVAGFTTTGHRPAAHAAACDALDARNNRSVGTDTPASARRREQMSLRFATCEAIWEFSEERVDQNTSLRPLRVAVKHQL